MKNTPTTHAHYDHKTCGTAQTVATQVRKYNRGMRFRMLMFLSALCVANASENEDSECNLSALRLQTDSVSKLVPLPYVPSAYVRLTVNQLTYFV